MEQPEVSIISQYDVVRAQLAECSAFLAELCRLRWRVLLLCCLMSLGCHFVANVPTTMGVGDHSTVQARLHTRGVVYTAATNDALITTQSIVGPIAAICVGIAFRWMSAENLAVAVTTAGSLGAGASYASMQVGSTALFFAGQVTLSAAASAIVVVQCASMMAWFGHEQPPRALASAFGVILFACGGFTVLGDSLAPVIAQPYRAENVPLCGFLLCLVSTYAAFANIAVHTYAKRIDAIPTISEDESQAVDRPAQMNCHVHFSRFLVVALACYVLSGAVVNAQGRIASDILSVKYNITTDETERQVHLAKCALTLSLPMIGIATDLLKNHLSVLCITTAAAVAALHLLLHVAASIFVLPLATVLSGALQIACLLAAVQTFTTLRRRGLGFGLFFGLQNLSGYVAFLALRALMHSVTPASPCVFHDNATVSMHHHSCPSTAPSPLALKLAEGLIVAASVVVLFFTVAMRIASRGGEEDGSSKHVQRTNSGELHYGTVSETVFLSNDKKAYTEMMLEMF